MTRDEQIIYLHSQGSIVRELAEQFNLSYSEVYKIINNHESAVDKLRKEVSNLKSALAKRNEEVEATIAKLEQSKVDNIKILVRASRLSKRVEILEAELIKSKEEAEEANREMLCRESKTLGWQAWKEKYDPSSPSR